MAAAATLRTPLGRRVKVVEHGTGEAGGVPPQRGGERWRVEAGVLAAQPPRVAAAAPERVDALAVVEPEAYALLRTQDADAYTRICDLRDRWRAHVGAGRCY
jgi:hypothetical protein